jgi:putative transposase
MTRNRRIAPAGHIFHVVNRGSRKGHIFDTAGDYCAFEALLVSAVEKFRLALLAYCLMPNHWHFVISPPTDRALSRSMRWLAGTHAQRWRLHTATVGQGAVYQGRFKDIPIQADHHFLWVCRYVERNACRASLVRRAEDWPWCSLSQRLHNPDATWLARWPIPEPADWVEHVNRPQTDGELDAFRRLVREDEPFGGEEWKRTLPKDMSRLSRRQPGRRARETVLCK